MAGEGPETFFELKVRPVLAGTCVKCHGPVKSSGGLRLDSREAMLKGGESGPAVVPGDPGASLLIRAIGHADESLEMPPEQAAARRGPGRPRRVGRRRGAMAEVRSRRAEPIEGQKHWAFEPLSGRVAARRPDRLGRGADRPLHRGRASRPRG